jgi:uncharacterized protein
MAVRPTIADEFLSIVDDIDARISLPRVRQVWLPRLRDTPRKSGEFGAVILDDGSVGLMFVLLGDTLRAIRDRVSPDTAVGMDPVELAQAFKDPDPATKALGLGAINAIGQHLIRASGFEVDTETNSLGSLDPQPGDHFGMVGFFPPLVRRLRAQNIDLTVIELKEALVQQAPRFQVTLDPAALGGCNKILCTSTMLLNDSIDPILGYCGQADEVVIIGPGAGFLPDALFARGVDTVGGHQVVDMEGFIARIEGEEKWGSTSRKYCFHRRSYPGYGALLDTVG